MDNAPVALWYLVGIAVATTVIILTVDIIRTLDTTATMDIKPATNIKHTTDTTTITVDITTTTVDTIIIIKYLSDTNALSVQRHGIISRVVVGVLAKIAQQ